MNFRDLLTRKRIAIACAFLVVALGVGAYFVLRRPPRVHMEKYIPGSALAFIEVANLSDVLDGITGTNAWSEIAPVLGMSSQLRQIGFAADLMGRTGLGPEEAVVAGRAQYAFALTSLETETGMGDEGAYLNFRPRFALVVETHSAPDVAARLVGDRASIFAQRIYGESTRQETENYLGTELMIFRGPSPERQMIAASSGSTVLISNHAEAIKSCLDAINNRAPTLAENATLQQNRPLIGSDAPVFAFVTQAGIETLSKMGPALFASRVSTDPENISATANLFGHLSKQAAIGFLYSSEFDSGGVVERYLTILHSEVGGPLADLLKPAPSANSESLKLVPAAIEDFTLLSVREPGDLPERVLKELSPRVDIVAGVALREVVLNFQKQLGLNPSDPASKAVGDEVTLIRFVEDGPMAMIVRVKDRAEMLPAVERYLKQEGATISLAQHNATEIILSSNEDSRAAAFINNYLVLATHDQIIKIVDAGSNRKAIADDRRFTRVFRERPPGTSIISYRPEVKDVGEMMLALSRLTRASDGSRELLEHDRMRAALNRVIPSVSFTEFRDNGIYTETRSAIGNYSLIASFISDEEQR